MREFVIPFWLLFSICIFILSSGCQKPAIQANQKPIKTLFLKKHLNFRNAWIHTAYFLNKSPKKQTENSEKKGWILTFSDEFDSLDLKKWRPGQPWGEVHPLNLHQYYDASEVKVKNGHLYLGGSFKPKRIRVNDSIVNIPYAIGLINSDISFKQKYGFFAIRSKNPSGPATWPAFWLTGATRWPPEIDIFEMYGRKSGHFIHHQFTSIHWGKTENKTKGYLTRKIKLPADSDSLFHIYACEWSPTYVKFYTDGRLTGFTRINKRLRELLDEEMVVIINNCFEAKYLKYLPENFKSNHFIVDWVRVYKKKI